MGKIKRIKAARKRAAIEQKLKKKRQRKQFLKILIPLLFIALLAGGGFYGYKKYKSSKNQTANKTEEKKEDKKMSWDKAPEMQIDAKKKYTARVETSKGAIEFELNAAETPNTVNNFVFLVRENFYDGVKFHRILKDFMIQTGDPEGTGAGGPGYKLDDEKFSGDYSPGTLAMANSGVNTNGSQFFIMTGDYSGGKLPKNYVIFGKVTAGMDVVKKIAETPTEDNGQENHEQSKPKEEVKITKVTIEEK